MTKVESPKRFVYANNPDLLWMLVFMRVQQKRRSGQSRITAWQSPVLRVERSSVHLCDMVRRGWVTGALMATWKKEKYAHRIGDESTHWSNHIESLKWRSNRNARARRARYRKENPGWRALQSIRSRLRMALCGIKKVKSTVALLGCSVDQFKRHIESKFQPGMSWDNYGNRTWHIDHIIPCAEFDLTDPAQQRRAFHYSNQRPMWAHENASKGSKTLKQQCLSGLLT